METCKKLELAEDMRSILGKEEKRDIIYQQFKNLVRYHIDRKYQALSRSACTALMSCNNSFSKSVNYSQPTKWPDCLAGIR